MNTIVSNSIPLGNSTVEDLCELALVDKCFKCKSNSLLSNIFEKLEING